MRATNIIMGMPITIEVLGSDVSGPILDAAFDEFRRLDDVFSTYKPASVISRIRRGELAAAEAGDEVAAVLEACRRLKTQTNGYFDAYAGGQLEPSGYVKGWAIEQVARLLDSRGITRYCVEAGGDMQLRGGGPDGKAWRIGIRHPTEADKMAKLLRLTNLAVATSGNYERGQHIYNPHTGRLVDDPLSLTVVGELIGETDALATAAFAMGPNGLAFLQQQGFEAMVITRDQQVVMTPGFRRFEVRPD